MARDADEADDRLAEEAVLVAVAGLYYAGGRCFVWTLLASDAELRAAVLAAHALGGCAPAVEVLRAELRSRGVEPPGAPSAGAAGAPEPPGGAPGSG